MVPTPFPVPIVPVIVIPLVIGRYPVATADFHRIQSCPGPQLEGMLGRVVSRGERSEGGEHDQEKEPEYDGWNSRVTTERPSVPSRRPFLCALTVTPAPGGT